MLIASMYAEVVSREIDTSIPILGPQTDEARADAAAATMTKRSSAIAAMMSGHSKKVTDLAEGVLEYHQRRYTLCQ